MPYGRVCIVPLAPDGTPNSERAGSAEDFLGSLFDASLDASEGKAWERRPENESNRRWWSTQGRQIRLAKILCGVAVDLVDSVRGKVAQVLSVASLLLLDQVATIKQNPGYRSRGEAVRRVLSQLSLEALTYEHLCVVGFGLSLWGEPWFWDVSIQRFRKSEVRVFLASEIGQARSPPS